ncbi:MAG: 30S ribosomal protein S13 [Thermoplasmata archaeon]|nr:30S ribosomal protein S13 [Thermoplasmata archaeon]
MSIAPKNPSDAEATPAASAAKAPEAPEGDKPKKEKGGKGRDGKDGKDSKDGKEAKGKSGKGGPPGAKKKTKVAPDNPNFRYIVRVAGTDLDGLRPAALALTGVRGVGLRIAEVACRMASVNAKEMIGNLPEPTVDGIEAALSQLPTKLPPWMLNHPSDRTTGEVHHFFGPELETSRRDDVNQMKMIRSYRGVRHERGQKVRGQRTRSNGRTGMAAGVIKKTAKEAAAAAGKTEKSGGGGAAAPAAPAAATPAAAPAGEKKAGTTEKKAAPAAEKKG